MWKVGNSTSRTLGRTDARCGCVSPTNATSPTLSGFSPTSTTFTPATTEPDGTNGPVDLEGVRAPHCHWFHSLQRPKYPPTQLSIRFRARRRHSDNGPDPFAERVGSRRLP